MAISHHATARSRASGVWAVTVLGCVLGLDQLTKWIVVRELGRSSADHRLSVWDPYLALEYVENTGAAFGLLRGQGPYLLVLAVVVVTGLIAFLRWAVATPALAASIGLLIGGALGNALDRVRLGYVVDFVAVGIWPTFNLADSAITCGVLLFIWTTLRQEPLSRGAVVEESDAVANRASPRDSGRPISASFGRRSTSKPERGC